MQVIPFCPEVKTLKVIIQRPALQSSKFPCATPDCFGGQVKFNECEFDEEEGQIVGLVGFTDKAVAEDGRPLNNEPAKKTKNKD